MPESELVAALEEHARRFRGDFDEIARSLPEDPQTRAAAWASVLGYDPLMALKGATMEELEQAKLEQANRARPQVPQRR
jgi:hypothetical protein